MEGIVLNLRDITSQQHLEEKLRQSQKLESIGRLAGGVAHDFNNLLTVILNCTEALESDASAGLPAGIEDIQGVKTAAKRASNLTRQLLAFARKQVIAPMALDLNQVVRDSESLLRRVLGEHINLVVELSPALWLTLCDPGQVEQVIVNLAVNARDAMVNGGKLTLATQNVRVTAEEAMTSPDKWQGISSSSWSATLG